MAFPTLTLPFNPSQEDYQAQTSYRVRTAKFGDGYEQRIADGINTQPRTVQLSIVSLTQAQRNTLMSFLNARGGIEPFYYTLLGESTPRLFTTQQVTETVQSGALFTLSFVIMEVFDLG